MRTFLWTCTLALFFVSSVSAQTLKQLQETINTNFSTITPEALNELGRKPAPPELVEASKAIADAAAKIYTLPNLDPKDRQSTLQREAVALIVLAYAETSTYYPKLTLISDELERRGLPKIVKETEKHVLEIGAELATRTGNNAINLKIESIQPLAERMVLYAEQFPGTDSMGIIDRFLKRIRAMDSQVARDRRLAVAAPIFQKYYKTVNHTKKANELDPDIYRSTLPGQYMTVMLGVDINGKDFNSDSVKDKVVLFQFWGTWCPNCIEKMPELIALYEKYHAKGFEIIGVNTGVQGDDERKLKQYLETTTFGGKKIPWTVLHEGLSARKNKNMKTMTEFYGIDELPVYILVGRDGKVINLHPLPSTLDDLVGKATSIQASIEYTEEELKLIEENQKKSREADDQQIRLDLGKPL